MAEFPEAKENGCHGIPPLRGAFGHHTPDKAAEFTSYGSNRNVTFLLQLERQMVESSAQPFIGPVSVSDHLCRISILFCLERLGFVSDTATRQTLGGFNQQTTQMRVSCFRDAQMVVNIRREPSQGTRHTDQLSQNGGSLLFQQAEPGLCAYGSR